MKIAILGTRGIPNNYGGFEQFAEYLSTGLVRAGHQVWVYTALDHPYKESLWNGVQLIRIFDPEKKTGTWGQFIYDLLCIMDARKRDFDIIYQLGYTSSSVWGRLLPSKPAIVTNMDGLEWKRTKYNKYVRLFLRRAEKWAVRTSDYLVADSLGIQRYLTEKFGCRSTYIPYGTYLFNEPDQRFISKYDVEVFAYHMLIARMEPENNLEMILDGVVLSNSQVPFLVIGNYRNKYGTYLYNKYSHDKRIRFLGPEYDINALNNLRYYSRLYFHGHSVGGTNPSLLEAMGSGSLVCAHSNEFNQAILGTDAFYFNSASEVRAAIDSDISLEDRSRLVTNLRQKVTDLYMWPKIVSDYEQYFKEITDHPARKK